MRNKKYSQKEIDLTCKKLKKGKTAADISDELEQDFALIDRICHVAELFGPDYDVEKIYATLKKERLE